uniref:Heat shock protein 70 n=1 Tax=Panagrolaimus sp. ES5 TaxID=591445 RepID=A0AC34F7V3_9BILA
MVAIGIDLGTTNSCVASYTANGVEVIANRSGIRTTPSFVLLTDEELRVGKSAKETSAKNCQNLIYDAKRMIGKSFTDQELQNDITNLKWPFKIQADSENQPKICIDNLSQRKKLYSPEEISCLVLQEVIKIAEEFHLGHGNKLTDAVITVPAYFKDEQRRATEKAAALAGLNVLRLINEPSAAGLAFCYQRLRNDFTKKTNILVFDLGGGTFDVSIMRISRGDVEVKVVAGNTHLGGNDFDARLMKFFIQKLKEENGKDISGNSKAIWKLKDIATKAKEHLSEHNHFEATFYSLDLDFEYDIKRTEFENLCHDLFMETMEVVDGALKDAYMSAANIDEVLLVGGSSRIPKIQEMLIKKFGENKINKTINGDEAVAYGAAIQAAIINGEIGRESNIILMDIIPLSIGLKVANCSCNCVCILEGEHSETDKNNVLGTFTVTNVPPNKKGAEKVDVTYEIDANGILHASAILLSTGEIAEIRVNYNKKRLDSEKVRNMLNDLSLS